MFSGVHGKMLWILFAYESTSFLCTFREFNCIFFISLNDIDRESNIKLIKYRKFFYMSHGIFTRNKKFLEKKLINGLIIINDKFSIPSDEF